MPKAVQTVSSCLPFRPPVSEAGHINSIQAILCITEGIYVTQNRPPLKLEPLHSWGSEMGHALEMNVKKDPDHHQKKLSLLCREL